MSKLFNGDCFACQKFKPRCADVRLKIDSKAYSSDVRVLCDDCRRTTFNGRFRMESGGHK